MGELLKRSARIVRSRGSCTHPHYSQRAQGNALFAEDQYRIRSKSGAPDETIGSRRGRFRPRPAPFLAFAVLEREVVIRLGFEPRTY